jgi:antitoxin component YwqK of YwqJK toxin-antitoxin module
MKAAATTYSNGQKVTEQTGDILTYYFEDGTIKAQGKLVDGIMQGEWIFNKKEGYLWQVGHFNEAGQKHGLWTRYNPDGSIQKEQNFLQGKQVK